MIICDKNNCTGCSACYNVCCTKAITMQEDKYGFWYPHIDSKKCRNCGLCKKVCPSLNKPKAKIPIKIFASYAKDEKIHRSSTSGGVATIFAQKAILLKGVAYGAAFTDNLILKHILVDDLDKLLLIQGTKYVQSKIENTYKEIKKLLTEKPIIVFIGTPCQISGLLNYLGENPDNLITINFVCGGVPSQKFLFDELHAIYPKFKDITNVKFRTNTIYGMWIKNNEKTIKYQERWKSSYFRGFDERLILRDSCYNCQYASHERVGDITIGDFWGLNSGELLLNKDVGISLIMATTQKGLDYIDLCKDLIVLEEHKFEEAIKENPRLNSSVLYSQSVDKFRRAYERKGFTSAVNSVVGIKYRIYLVKSVFKKNKLLTLIYRKIKRGIKR